MIFLKRFRVELLLILLALLLTGNLVTIFSKRPATASYGPLIEAYNRIIEAKDQLIMVQEKHKEELKQERAVLQAMDSALIIQLAANQPKYLTNEKKYNQIPVTVDGLDRGQLRREFADY